VKTEGKSGDLGALSFWRRCRSPSIVPGRPSDWEIWPRGGLAPGRRLSGSPGFGVGSCHRGAWV